VVKRVFAPLFLVIVLTVIAGCAPAAQQSSTIKIGLEAPLTGDYAYEGKGMQNSVQLLVDQTNAAGGINGQQVQLLVEDDKGDPKEASLVADRMVSNGVKAVVGAYNSGATAPASAIYNKAGILQITPSSTRVDLSAQGYQRFFRVCYLDNMQAPFAARLMKEVLGNTKIAILHDNSTYAQGLAEETKKSAEALGMQDDVGSLEPGKFADFIAVDVSESHFAPIDDPYSALVYGANQDDVRLTVVGGRPLFRDHGYPDLDAEAIRAAAFGVREKLRERMRAGSVQVGAAESGWWQTPTSDAGEETP